MSDEVEEKLLTLECVMSELGYRTVRNKLTKTIQVVVGEVRICCDEVELVNQSEKYPDQGYIANLFSDGNFIAGIYRWIDTY